MLGKSQVASALFLRVDECIYKREITILNCGIFNDDLCHRVVHVYSILIVIRCSLLVMKKKVLICGVGSVCLWSVVHLCVLSFCKL